MGIFDIFKKKNVEEEKLNYEKIKEEYKKGKKESNTQSITPTPTTEPQITTSQSNKKYPFKIDYNSVWYKETLDVIPQYRWNYRGSFRGFPKSLITDEQLDEWFIEWCEVWNLLDRTQTHKSKGYYLKQVGKEIDNYSKLLKEQNYNTETKEWGDFDITHQFLQVRTFMINRKVEPIPSWIWNIRQGKGMKPFSSLFRVCRDYVKKKKSPQLVKNLFENVCNWENGCLFRDGEELKDYEEPLWIMWNRVGKEFLSMKTIMKKDDNGLDWIKNEVKDYILSKRDYYNQFNEKSEYIISNELIKKFEE